MSAMHWKKAIPATMVGIAFFLVSCQPRIPIKVPISTEESASALHRMAEIYFESEEYGKAMGLFNQKMAELPKDESVVNLLFILV